MQTLADMGPSKLLHSEQERIRAAADTLLFSSELTGSAESALEDAHRLCDTLVQSGRWERATAARLASDLRGCGPEEAARLRAA